MAISPMQKVSSMVSSNLGDTLSNIKNWGGLFYNAADYGIIPGPDVTEKLQSLVNRANLEGRTTIVFLPGQYYVTSITNDENIIYFGDGAVFIGGYTRTINSFKDFLGVKDFFGDILIDVKYPPSPLASAKVDGVTDDTSAIQAIINYVNSIGGGTVYIPKGNCLVSGLDILSDVHLLGAGEELTTLRLKNNSSNHLLYAISENNIRISNLTLDGNKENQVVNTYFGIEANSVKKLIIENVESKNCSAHGIDIRNSSDVLVTKCELHDNYNVGVNFNNVTTGIINKNVCTKNGMGGIYIEANASRNCIVSENISFSNGSLTTHQGILIQANNVHVVNNFSYSNAGTGIDLGDCSNITVSGNYVYDNGNIGIEVNSSNNSITIGNIVIANGRTTNSSGIMVIESGYSGGSNNNIVSNNLVSNGGTSYQYNGIEIGANANSTIVTDNIVTGSGTNKNINDSGTNSTIRDNIGWKNEGMLVATFDASSTGDKYVTIPNTLNVSPSMNKMTFGITQVNNSVFTVYNPVCISADLGSIVVKVTVVTAGSSGATGRLIVNVGI